MMRPVYKVKNLKSLNRKVESLFGRFLMGLEYIFNQSGPVTMGASQVCGFVKSDPSRATPNLQFHVSPVSTDILGVTPMHDFEGITPTVANVRPTSRGEINIVSSDTRDNPKIKMNYLCIHYILFQKHNSYNQQNRPTYHLYQHNVHQLRTILDF